MLFISPQKLFSFSRYNFLSWLFVRLRNGLIRRIRLISKFMTSQPDDGDELFLWYGWPAKGVWPYFQLGPLSGVLTIANLRHTASRVWTCAEPEFRFSWMKLCSSDNHYTTAPQHQAWLTNNCNTNISPSHIWLIILIRFITLKNTWMKTEFVKTEKKCSELVNSEFKIIRKSNSLHQIMTVSK